MAWRTQWGNTTSSDVAEQRTMEWWRWRFTVNPLECWLGRFVHFDSCVCERCKNLQVNGASK